LPVYQAIGGEGVRHGQPGHSVRDRASKPGQGSLLSLSLPYGRHECERDTRLPCPGLLARSRTLVWVLRLIIQRVIETHTMPEEWKKSMVMPLPKKGDLTQCSNYRGIALLCVGYKVLSYFIAGRLAPLAHPTIGSYQGGFMPGRSTVDQISVLRRILEHRYERGVNTYILFVDFAKAYGSVHRPSLYDILASPPISAPRQLLDLIRVTQEGTKCAVRFHGSLFQFFDVASGVKQGEPVAPMLFNIALQGVVGELHQEQRHPELLERPVLLAYADDIAIVAATKQEEARVGEALEANAARVGLKISPKTEFKAVSRNSPDPTHGNNIDVGGTVFQRIADLKYLGSTINERNDIAVEVRARTLAGLRSLHALGRAYKSSNLSVAAKARMWTTVGRPAVTYATQTLALTAAQEARFAIAENNALRRIAGPVYHPTGTAGAGGGSLFFKSTHGPTSRVTDLVQTHLDRLVRVPNQTP